MNDPTKKILFLTAIVSILILMGASTGFAQCSGNIITTAASVRAQGTVEALGAITIGCTVTPATSTATTISVILTSSSSGLVAGAGSTTVAGWTNTCSPAAPNSKSAFPCPSISSTIAPVGQPRVAVGSNAVTFSFTPAAGLQTFTITGIRANVAGSGLAPGSAITVNVAAIGGLTGQTSDLLLGLVNNVFGSGTGFTSPALSITTCTPVIPAASGAVLFANPDSSATAANSLKVSFVEGFLGAFVSTATSDGGAVGVQGLRFLIQLTGIPNGISVYAPETVSAASAAATGSVTGGLALTVLSLVSGAATDGSGGTPVPSYGGDRFDLIGVSGSGTATLVYEVTTSASLTGFETATLFIALTGTPTSVGIVSGSVSLAPVGPPTANAAIPQFSASVGSTFVANAGPCGAVFTFSSSPEVLTDVGRLSFTAPSGTSPAPEQFNVLITGPTPLSWTAAVAPVTGGNWLTISPTSGTGDGPIIGTVNSSSLSLGSYSANIVVTSSGAGNSPYTLPAVLTVAATLLSVTPASLTFTPTPGANPAPQQLTISTNTGTLSWSAAATTASGGNWLSVTPTSGSTPGTATVSVSTAGLLAGTYQGTVTVSASGAGNGSQAINVSLTVGASPPVILANGIVNGASFASGAPVSPGSIASLFGSSLAATAQAATSLPLPTILGGTQVLVNQAPAPLFYVSPSQINFQMPFTAGGPTQVSVVANQISTAAVAVAVAPQAPGIFARNAGGSGQGDILNQDSSLNSAQNPAAAGTVIAIYATGLGVTNPLAIAGQPGGTSPLNETVLNPVVTIGGITTNVVFSGLAPGFAGAYQVNTQIPAGMPSGSSIPLIISIGGVTSNTVTVAIQ